jgi:hypothetical protein
MTAGRHLELDPDVAAEITTGPLPQIGTVLAVRCWVDPPTAKGHGRSAPP